MNRRNFIASGIAALSALPFVGKLFAKESAATFVYGMKTIHRADGTKASGCGTAKGVDFRLEDGDGIYSCHLTDCNVDLPDRYTMMNCHFERCRFTHNGVDTGVCIHEKPGVIVNGVAIISPKNAAAFGLSIERFHPHHAPSFPTTARNA